MKKNDIVGSALILSIGGVLAKVFSAVYRIFLTRILGGEGIGLYQLIFPFYSLCVVLTTAGLPMAISKVVAKYPNSSRAIVKKITTFLGLFAFVVGLVLFFGGEFIAKLQGEGNLKICYMILAPSVVIISISSILRGYFQGMGNFSPSAISNVGEQFAKMVLGLFATWFLMSYGLIYAVIGAVVSIVLSEIFSFCLLLFVYNRNKSARSNKPIEVRFMTMLKDIIPITLTNLILPISSFIDSLLVVNLLKLNFSQEVAVFLYGLESGAVSSIVTLPTVFSFAMASAILPNLSKGNKVNKSKKISFAVKLVLLICVPCAVLFVFMPKEILTFLYGSKLNTSGINGINIASTMLALNSISMLCLAVSQVYSSGLQAVDKRYATVKNLTIAVILKLIAECVLMPIPNINIYALVVGNIVSYLVVFLLNRHSLEKLVGVIDLKFFAKLTFSAIVMGLFILAFNTLESPHYYTIALALTSGMIYLTLIYNLDVFNKGELAMQKYIF